MNYLLNSRPHLPRWAAAHINIGVITADPDGDNYNNLLEYALGLDPAVPDHGVTSLTVEPTTLIFTYTRPDAITDVTYQLEWASRVDSATWLSIGVTQRIVSDDGLWRTIQATLPRGATGRRFVRLKVAY